MVAFSKSYHITLPHSTPFVLKNLNLLMYRCLYSFSLTLFITSSPFLFYFHVIIAILIINNYSIWSLSSFFTEKQVSEHKNGKLLSKNFVFLWKQITYLHTQVMHKHVQYFCFIFFLKSIFPFKKNTTCLLLLNTFYFYCSCVKIGVCNNIIQLKNRLNS